MQRTIVVLWLKFVLLTSYIGSSVAGLNVMKNILGNQARTFEERYKEHIKAPLPIFEHQNITGHTTSVENFRIIAREGQNIARAIKETIYISQQPYPK